MIYQYLTRQVLTHVRLGRQAVLVLLTGLCLSWWLCSTVQAQGPGGYSGRGGGGYGPGGGQGGYGQSGYGQSGYGQGGFGQGGYGQGGPGPGGFGPGGPGGPGGSGRRGDESPDARKSRADRMKTFLTGLDANHNGMIEESEVTAQSRGYLERAMGRLGIEVKFPLSLAKVNDGIARYVQNGPANAPGGAAGTSATNRNGAPTAYSSSSGVTNFPSFGSATTTTATPTSSVQGFGDASTQPAPANSARSGASYSSGTVSGRPTTTPTSPATSASGIASSSASTDQMNYRIRNYAASLLRRYDTNRNGLLEKDEWSKMSMDVSGADTNHDGVITLDELTTWLVAYTQNRSNRGSSSTAASNSPATGTTTSSATSVSTTTSSSTSYGTRSNVTPSTTAGSVAKNKTYRFLLPGERLPNGLPSWFIEKDVNHDGQVTMAEYSSNWTDEVAAEFARYDLNNDGVITAEECLRVERAKTATARR